MRTRGKAPSTVRFSACDRSLTVQRGRLSRALPSIMLMYDTTRRSEKEGGVVMRILVVGSGGREHALCWAIARSPRCAKLFCAPGNAGIAQVAERVTIGDTEVAKLVDFAKREKIDLVV